MKSEEQKELAKAIEKAIPLWMVSQEQPSFHFIFELEDIYPIHFDLLTDKCVYHIFFDPLLVPSIEDKILILLMFSRVLN